MLMNLPATFTFPDQDVLNYLLQGNVYWLDSRYNVINTCVWGDGKSVMIHFVGPKPWHSWYVSEGNPLFDNEYDETMAASVWSSLGKVPPTTVHHYRVMSQRCKKLGNWIGFLHWQKVYLKAKLGKILDF